MVTRTCNGDDVWQKIKLPETKAAQNFIQCDCILNVSFDAYFGLVSKPRENEKRKWRDKEWMRGEISGRMNDRKDHEFFFVVVVWAFFASLFLLLQIKLSSLCTYIRMRRIVFGNDRRRNSSSWIRNGNKLLVCIRRDNNIIQTSEACGLLNWIYAMEKVTKWNFEWCNKSLASN